MPTSFDIYRYQVVDIDEPEDGPQPFLAFAPEGVAGHFGTIHAGDPARLKEVATELCLCLPIRDGLPGEHLCLDVLCAVRAATKGLYGLTWEPKCEDAANITEEDEDDG